MNILDNARHAPKYDDNIESYSITNFKHTEKQPMSHPDGETTRCHREQFEGNWPCDKYYFYIFHICVYTIICVHESFAGWIEPDSIYSEQHVLFRKSKDGIYQKWNYKI